MSAFDWTEERKKNYFYTDASEVEDLYDSAGGDGLADRPTSCESNVNSELFSATKEDRETDVQSVSKPQGPHLHERIMFRKHFT